MGLFDFLKGNKKTDNQPKEKSAEDNQSQPIKYETKITAREVTADKATVENIVEKIIEEDPFKNFYDGKTDSDFSPFTDRLYKYQSVTTVNVDLVSEESNQLKIYIEGILLGTLPDDKVREINRYRGKDLLTAFVYVTGGPFKEYDKKSEAVKEGSAPYGLDIYIQFS